MIRWDDNGVPHSLTFNDKYFCTENGYEESFFVSCQGNKLEERFKALNPSENGTFTIIETGFGTGLSFCCVWELWARTAPQSWQLNFISLELYPLGVDDMNRALSVWPSIQKYKEALLSKYTAHPGEIARFHFEDRVNLTIVFDDVIAALSRMIKEGLAPKGADAWFLNGFSPFSNPKMWTVEVFKGMVPLSRRGTTLSTFTVAGHVRRGLESQGFKVERIPGFGKKKTVLTGQFS